MYSINNNNKYNKYKVAHQVRLVRPETPGSNQQQNLKPKCFRFFASKSSVLLKNVLTM